jgi:Leucine-rich repeat (LRR) protein
MRLAFVFVLAASSMFAASPKWIDELGGKVEHNQAGDITAVHLRGTWVTDAEMLDLARLPQLQRLDLSHTRITDDGLLYLKPLKQVQDLNLLYAEQITDQGMAAVKEWKNLKRLNLRGTRIFDGTLAILSGLTQLESLDIAYTQVTDNGLDALVPLTHLKELSIGRSKVGNNALELLRLLPTLEYLDLGGPHPGPGGYRTTAGTPMDDDLPRAISELKQLRVLKLSYSQIRADGLRLLASLDQVSKLALTGCPRVDDGALAELAKWKSLKYLDVQETSVTEQGVAHLEKSKPGLVILHGPHPPSHPAANKESVTSRI